MTVVVAPAAGGLGAVAVVEAPHLLDVQRGQLTVAHAGHARVPRHDGLLPVGGEAWRVDSVDIVVSTDGTRYYEESL